MGYQDRGLLKNRWCMPVHDAIGGEAVMALLSHMLRTVKFAVQVSFLLRQKRVNRLSFMVGGRLGWFLASAR